jgi:hypothetical protein
MNLRGSGKGPVASSSEYSNETLGFVKDREFLGQLSGSQLRKKDTAP